MHRGPTGAANAAAAGGVDPPAAVVLGRISGLESTYLTLVDFEQHVQQILYARNTGDLEIPEGLQVDWTDTLCRRALEGGPAYTSEVPKLYPDSDAARDLGIQTFVTFPVMDPSGEVFGTLCGASGRHIELSEDVRLVIETLAEMIPLQLAQDAAMQQVADQAAQLATANASLDRLASTDALTGLFNRRHLDRELTPCDHRDERWAQRSASTTGSPVRGQGETVRNWS